LLLGYCYPSYFQACYLVNGIKEKAKGRARGMEGRREYARNTQKNGRNRE
jgi:hypothetical protein